MKTKSLIRCLRIVLICTAVLLTACATRPAPDIAGRWKPVNRYAEATQAIPLNQAYIYQAAPMDGTLKNMLTRWAGDSSLTLAYENSSDYTLHAPVAQVHTPSLQEALSMLTGIYAEQGISIVATSNQIVVRLASASAPAITPSQPAASQTKKASKKSSQSATSELHDADASSEANAT